MPVKATGWTVIPRAGRFDNQQSAIQISHELLNLPQQRLTNPFPLGLRVYRDPIEIERALG